MRDPPVSVQPVSGNPAHQSGRDSGRDMSAVRQRLRTDLNHQATKVTKKILRSETWWPSFLVVRDPDSVGTRDGTRCFTEKIPAKSPITLGHSLAPGERGETEFGTGLIWWESALSQSKRPGEGGQLLTSAGRGGTGHISLVGTEGNLSWAL